VQTDGDGVRIRLSNRYGLRRARGRVVTVGVVRQEPSADLVGGQAGRSDLRRSGRHEHPAYSDVVSDPVALPVTHGAFVAVSLFLPRIPSVMISEHQNALQTSYLSVPGDHSGDGDGAAFTEQLTAWPVLSGIDVHTTRPATSVLVLGDSITDGLGTPQDGDQRWTDALVAHLAPPGQTPATTVVNGGIAGNELLSDAPDSTGDSPQRRLSWEVPSGAGDVILEIGNNDVRQGRSAQEIIDGLTRFAGAAKARGLRVFLTTITPSNPGPPDTAPRPRTRSGRR
jgi:lysophospholipase L1-like esterase